MAKKVKKHPPKGLTRKQLSRLEKERRIERLLIWSVAVVGVVVVGVLTYGFVVEKVLKAREPVAIVGDTPITTAEFQARVRFARAQIQSELRYMLYQQQSLDPTDADAQLYLEYIQRNIRELQNQLSSANELVIGEQALDQLIQEELVRREAESRGITVTSEELQREIELFFGYDRNPATPTPELDVTTSPLTPTDAPTAVPLPTPTLMTEQGFLQRYDDYLKESLKPLRISEQQYRSWIEVSLLMEKLQEQMAAEVPTVAEQVKLWLLALDSEERADELAARLDAGEDFQTLADELRESEDEDVADGEYPNGYGTELDWFPRNVLESRLGMELADQAFSLEVGEHSQPVLGEGGTWYSIIGVVGHEVRELDQFLREQLAEEAFQEWLEAQQILVERRTYSDRVPTEP